MSNEVETHFIDQYAAGIKMLAQQLTSQLRSAVTVLPLKGKKRDVDQVGAVELQPRTTRHADLPIVETPHARRWITAQRYYARDFIDEADKLQVLNDPTNAYTRAFAGAAARKFDKVFIDGILGTNFTGEEGTTPVALPGGQKIPDGATGFTFDKLKQAVRMLRQNHALTPGDTVHVALGSFQEEEFINATEVKSSDFTQKRIIDAGGVNEFYRVMFHYIEDFAVAGDMLPKNGTVRSLPLWVKSGALVGERQAAGGRIAWLDEKETFQVSGFWDGGASREQEVKVVQIDVQEP